MKTLDAISAAVLQTHRSRCHHSEHASAPARTLVAIAGPPGSGKSTLASRLADALNTQGVVTGVVPMDGFHLDNGLLAGRGHLPRKGAEHTFDGNGFVATMSRIHANEHTVYVPVFDRERELAVACAQAITPDHGLVIVEGNYLLLRTVPWASLRDFFTMSFFLNPGIEVIEQRILERWKAAGLDETTIHRRTYQNDLPNANAVLDESDLSGVIELTS